jgi:hypothetical protein
VQEGWDAALLQEAAKLIGYRPKALLEAEQIRKGSLNEAVLAKALAEVDIEPFTIQSVEQYKAQMLKKAHRGESLTITRFMHTSNKREWDGHDTVSVLGWPTWLASVGVSAVCAVLHFGGYHAGWGWNGHNSVELFKYMSLTQASHIMAWPAVPLAIWSVLMFLRYKKALEIQASWTSHQVHDTGENYNDGYKAAIPAFAIQRMVSLKKALPEVTFSVQELTVEKKELQTEKYLPPPAPDPFLVADYKGIGCYIDVWDEPGFEGRRTI